ncbi:calmodulin-2-like isoform X2 [Hippopotamus amphibius kiboko]|uniref:calmodulin-2-like isoform X2 n=1 Tax=Hippopotamus amphibius kiboko TaxID=575201 RepID=UPI0025930BCC|nr:calmodulin-2-like isoform X2 [Hippopotamus amphibius kiboko]XP_057570107.1 calmodulin-2-like isoform X2 [Hippopotamus amphibius kiboko]
MGISLTEKELKDLTQNLPVNADGKIVLNKLMDGVKAIIGEDIDICDTEDILENMGIEFTDEELLELLKKLPVDGGEIDVSKLDTVLGSMGMNLTEKELEDLTQSLPVDVDGKVDRKNVMDDVKAFTGEKIDINNLANVLSNKGTELPDTEYTELVKTLPVSGDGKVHKNRILKGVKSFKRGKVDSSNLKPLLEKMDIKLTEKEFEELKENLLMVCIVDTLVSPQRKFCPSLTAENF